MRWFKLREELDSAITLLTVPFNAPFIFSEHRFSSLFQSAEALCTEPRVDAHEVTEDEHEARVDAILSAARSGGVRAKDVDWAKRVLTPRNDKPLWERIDALVAGTGEIGVRLRDAAPLFGKVAASTRTQVSHPTGQKPKKRKRKSTRKKLDPIGRHWYGQGLHWVIRAHLLLALGFELAEVERRVLNRSSFVHALDEIRNNPPTK